MTTAQPGGHVEVLIIGAGVSGIDAACHLERDRPAASYVVLERRAAIGGTWDLFRYPGVRSDSDMLTFGYRFRPWTDSNVLADGASIRSYVTATAREYGVTEKVRFGRRVTRLAWSTDEQRWTAEATREAGGGVETWTADFLVAATGYYDYDAGYRPQFPGEARFGGRLVHPQFWPEGLDVRGKRVVVIGSGATAVTLVPALAADAAHVTMLQRSPTYVMSLPSRDRLAEAARRRLPAKTVYRLFRARNILAQRVLYGLSRARPALMKKLLLAAARKRVGEELLPHFTPRYDPWTQRLCVIPDGDLFEAVTSGRAEIVTDTIGAFTETGIRTGSGRHVAADVVVAATGLKVQILGGAQLVVDGVPIALRDVLTYKGVLVEDVPNLAVLFGYTNASWTLKADLACRYVVRLLAHMQRHGYTQAVPRSDGSHRDTGSVLGSLDAGYVRRGDAFLPRQGIRAPWRVVNDYLRDWVVLRLRPVGDGALEFATPQTAGRAAAVR